MTKTPLLVIVCAFMFWAEGHGQGYYFDFPIHCRDARDNVAAANFCWVRGYVYGYVFPLGGNVLGNQFGLKWKCNRDPSNPAYCQDEYVYEQCQSGLGFRFYCTNYALQTLPWISTPPPPPITWNPPRPTGPQTDGNKDFTCGISNTNRIIGGVDALKNEFPWQVSINYKKPDGSPSYCGGILISDQDILTAAHCVKYNSEFEVELGSSLLLSENAVIARVEKPVYHEQYTGISSLDNDVAVLQLTEPLVFSHSVSPVCLPEDGTNGIFYENKEAIASGWGVSRENVAPQFQIKKELQKTKLKTLSFEECTGFEGKKYPPNQILESMLCADGNETSTCSGDSGGPLVVEESGRFTVVGITSFGAKAGCLTKYPVFARVTYFLPWIKNHIKGTLPNRFN